MSCGLQVAGTEAVAQMLRDPGQLLAIGQALEQSLAFDRASASLLVYAAAATGSYAALPDKDANDAQSSEVKITSSVP